MRVEKDEEGVSLGRGYCRHETAGAVLISIDGEAMWLPQSQIHSTSEVRRLGDQGEVVITRWLAEQRGLV